MCPAAIDELALDFTAFFGLDQRHEAILTVHSPGIGVEPRVVRASAARFTMRAGESGPGFEVMTHPHEDIHRKVREMAAVWLQWARDNGYRW